MSNKTFAIFIGTISAIVNFLAIFALLYFTADYEVDADESFENAIEEMDKTIDMTEEKVLEFKEMTEDYVFGFLLMVLISCLLEAIVSILMVVGFKKGIPKLVAPYIYMTIIVMVINCIEIFVDADTSEDKEVTQFAMIIVCVFYAAIWFPIFKAYRKLKASKKTPLPVTVSSPVNPHYVEYEAPAVVTPGEFSHTATFVQSEIKAEVAEVAEIQSVYPKFDV